MKALYEDGFAGNFGGGPSGPKFTSVEYDLERGEVKLTWTSRTGRNYSIESTSDLQIWIELDDGIPSTGDTTSYTDTPAGEATVLYYRVVES